ncbi:hypothetical protein [Streptomyces sp. V2I9]|uniref:hypothetical protein n=1 Tax=Streptomyces sp. V2I9 TaxID=3042304 RepID=UPI002784566F|nr:hypothetical protein [Streptomyces sp. V2I9]MDQ0986171.1 hypothetical protein [Streptomyces sp. V2I9]
MKKMAAVVAMGSVLALGVGASPAVAAGNCGYVESCTTLSSGRLSIFLSQASTVENRLNVVVSYRKDSGSSINARFGYSYSGSNHWAGYFNQSAGTTKRSTWTNAYVHSTCKSAVGMMQVTGQQTFQTPPVTGC